MKSSTGGEWDGLARPPSTFINLDLGAFCCIITVRRQRLDIGPRDSWRFTGVYPPVGSSQRVAEEWSESRISRSPNK